MRLSFYPFIMSKYRREREREREREGGAFSIIFRLKLTDISLVSLATKIKSQVGGLLPRAFILWRSENPCRVIFYYHFYNGLIFLTKLYSLTAILTNFYLHFL